jgi:hypothetical protein
MRAGRAHHPARTAFATQARRVDTDGIGRLIHVGRIGLSLCLFSHAFPRVGNRRDPIVHLALRARLGEKGALLGDDAKGERVFFDLDGGGGMDGAEVDHSG